MIEWPKAPCVLAGLMVLAATPTKAQDTIHTNGWYQVNQVKFKRTCANRALQIIREHFMEVDRTIGRDVIPFDFETGEWDHVVYFPIALTKGGYDTIPPWSEWQAAFYEQEGGKEPAEALQAEFDDCIAVEKSEIARLMLASQGDD